MALSANTIGILLNLIGAFILLLAGFFCGWHNKDYRKLRHKRYYWMGWRPIFKITPPNEKPYWRIKLNCMISRSGALPPKNQWDLVAFLYVAAGVLLQLI